MIALSSSSSCPLCPLVEKDTYGNEVTRLARPLPVEYLLVDVPASTPLTPQFTFFTDDNITPFPVENRQVDGQVQEFNSLCTYMQQFNSDQFLEATSDFHLLLFIATMDMYPMKDHMLPLLEAIRNKDKQKALEWAQSEHWATVEQLISVTSTSSRPPQMSSFGNSSRTLPSVTAEGSGGIGVGTEPIANPPPDQALWTCSHCTFLNAADLAVCEMCNLPREDVEEYDEEMMRELF
ncbi:Nuclear protein localization protein 4 like protein [Trachymyrmex cornetzi]|uniref:Nuclear protein localization protein 4 like protein n=1 Tax=Trachymyrmex cornetzi TaxID=471704 RepID=A0A151IS17_9HYME|nr:Nuclear protein localization protein 4 like protein [Trachymyrmex cornetzi]